MHCMQMLQALQQRRGGMSMRLLGKHTHNAFAARMHGTMALWCRIDQDQQPRDPL